MLNWENKKRARLLPLALNLKNYVGSEAPLGHFLGVLARSNVGRRLGGPVLLHHIVLGLAGGVLGGLAALAQNLIGRAHVGTGSFHVGEVDLVAHLIADDVQQPRQREIEDGARPPPSTVR